MGKSARRSLPESRCELMAAGPGCGDGVGRGDLGGVSEVGPTDPAAVVCVKSERKMGMKGGSRWHKRISKLMHFHYCEVPGEDFSPFASPHPAEVLECEIYPHTRLPSSYSPTHLHSPPASFPPQKHCRSLKIIAIAFSRKKKKKFNLGSWFTFFKSILCTQESGPWGLMASMESDA